MVRVSGRGAMIAALVTSGFLLASCDDSEDAATQVEPEAPSVTVAGVAKREISETVSFIGQIEAVDEADIVPRVSGFLMSRDVPDGSYVREGDLLFEIEPNEYEANLAAAKADVAQTEAALALAEIELERSTQLLESDTVAQSRYDSDLANRNAAAAQLEAAKAQVSLAELNLGYTKILAPFEGRIGRVAFSTGDTVGPTAGPLATLIRLSPIYATFSISEGAYLSLLQEFDIDFMANREEGGPPVRLLLPNRTEFDEEGRIVFVDNRVDPQTGTIAMRVRFDNVSQLLSPGVFVTVEIQDNQPADKLVVPQAAVQRDQKGSFVLAVDPNGAVEQRYVELGLQQETYFAVESGLQEGEKVIVEGLQRVRPGVSVNAVPAADAPEG